MDVQGGPKNWPWTKWCRLAEKSDQRNILLSPKPSYSNPHLVTKSVTKSLLQNRRSTTFRHWRLYTGRLVPRLLGALTFRHQRYKKIFLFQITAFFQTKTFFLFQKCIFQIWAFFQKKTFFKQKSFISIKMLIFSKLFIWHLSRGIIRIESAGKRSCYRKKAEQ